MLIDAKTYVANSHQSVMDFYPIIQKLFIFRADTTKD